MRMHNFLTEAIIPDVLTGAPVVFIGDPCNLFNIALVLVESEGDEVQTRF